MKNLILWPNLLLVFIFWHHSAGAQDNIYTLMDRHDLSLNQIEELARVYFEKNGTGQGSGYKQYQRWIYERRFHVDGQGNFILPEKENEVYQTFISQQNLNKKSTIQWTELGPTLPSYVGEVGPGVGRITSIAILPNDTNVIFVSSPGGGIWKTTNAGSTWKPLMDNLNYAWMDVYNVCIDPSSSNVIYAALTKGGVIKSTDGGTKWNVTGTGPLFCKKVVVHPGNSKIVFASASNGLWRSSNTGVSWTMVESLDFEDIEFNPANPNIMYASRTDQTRLECVWRSADNGVNWKNIGFTNGVTTSGRTLLAVSPANPAVLYVLQSKGDLFGALYRSNDSGLTYKLQTKSSINYFGQETDGSGTTGQALYDMAICVNPKDVDEVHIGGLIAWKSTNGGVSFKAESGYRYPNTVGYIHPDIHAFEYINKTLFVGTDGGIFKSYNQGDDWIVMSNGLGIRQFYRISCSKTNPMFITAGAQDQGTSYRRSNGQWYDWSGGDGCDNTIDPTNANIAISTSQYGKPYKTTNAGSTFVSLTQFNQGNWVSPITYHPFSGDTVFAGWNGVFRSVNGGSNWSSLLSGTQIGLVTAIAVSPVNPKYIYAANSYFIFSSKDGGASWTKYASPSYFLVSICVSPLNPEKIWVLTDSAVGRLYVSYNMGAGFTNISKGLPALHARSVVVERNNIESLYVGTNIGVYYKDNANTNWVLHGTGLPLVAINELEIQESSGKLRVATYGRGVWESDLQSNSQCKAPSGLKSTTIKTGTQKFQWHKTSETVDFTLEFKLTADTVWTGAINTKDTMLTVGNFKPGATYDWRVRTNCPMNSSFTQSSFQVPGKCGLPLNLTVDSLRYNAGKFVWNKVAGIKYYQVEYKENSASNWSIKTGVKDTFYRVNSLVALTKYAWRVKTICEFDSGSYASAVFTTPSCGLPQKLETRNISATSTTFYWQPIPGASLYTFELRVAGATAWERTTNLADTTLTMIVLKPNTLYEWHVKSTCNSNFAQAQFTTTVAGIDPDLLAKSEQSIVIYPLPPHQVLRYSYYLPKYTKQVTTLILDMQGKVLYRKISDSKGGKVSEQLDISEFSKGLYYLSIQFGSSMYTKKFIISE